MTGAISIAFILVVLAWLGRRRKRVQRQHCTRTPRHDAYVDALHEWLFEPSIVEAAIDRGVTGHRSAAAGR